MDYADVKETVPKGKIEEITYTSQLTNKTHKALVQLPANYSQDEKYPVLYLIHGENDTENAWNDMSADQIINNAIAFKMAKEMIVVMPNVIGDNDEDIVKDFGTDLKPAIEAKYSVAQGRHNNAVAGYGLGDELHCVLVCHFRNRLHIQGRLLQLLVHFHMMERWLLQ